MSDAEFALLAAIRKVGEGRLEFESEDGNKMDITVAKGQPMKLVRVLQIEKLSRESN